MDTSEPAIAKSKGCWVSRWAFLFLLIAEFMLFDRMTSLHYARIYPRWNDQIQPLTESYTGYEFARANGFWQGIEHTLAKPAAQGELHSLWAILIFEITGHSSRSAALAVNMLAFLAWQAAFAFAVLRGSGSRAMAWIATGLTLTLYWPWSGVQGSAADFRLDQVSMCMMGISLAAALRTDGFRKIGWSSVFGFAVGLTMLTRFLTGTYFAVIFFGCLIWILVSREKIRRALNLSAAGVVAALVVAPFFWFNRLEIYNHYWIGHYLDPNGVLWSSHLSFADAFVQALEKLCTKQLGAAFWSATVLAVFVLTYGVLFMRGRSTLESGDAEGSWTKDAAILGVIFLIGPVLVLAAQNLDKMVVVVLGVSVPGTILLVVALCARLRHRIGKRVPIGVTTKVSSAAAIAVVTVGCGYFIDRQTAAPYDAEFASDALQINALADQIFAAARASGVAEPRVSVDRITDCFDGTTLRVICYERHKVWVPFIMELPTGVSEPSESAILDGMVQSDFVIATEGGPPGPWPYDRKTFALRPKILGWCDANLQLDGHYTIFGQHVNLYSRRETAPQLPASHHLLGSTIGDFSFCVKISPGPVKFVAKGMPPGLQLDEVSGWIRGRPLQIGTYTARVTAENSSGSIACDITFQFESSAFFAAANAPTSCIPGESVDVEYGAFDSGGQLDFIDVTDQTTGKLLERLSPGPEQRKNWEGHCKMILSLAGRHLINLRFVRLNPGEKDPYAFLDKSFEISVYAAPPSAK
jgi:hypothetical protein